MARVTGAIFTSHASWVTTPAAEWDAVRAKRHHRSDVPVDGEAEKADKERRLEEGLSVLGAKLKEFDPEVLVVFGDDQYECFGFDNLPSLSVFVGPEYQARKDEAPNPGNRPRGRDLGVVPTLVNHQGLATAILLGLLEQGFDPAFSTKLGASARGMAHAVVNPLRFFKLYDVPAVPVLMNAYYGPQMRARRCYEVGRAVRRVIEDYPEELRVVVIGSGGLWHTPNRDHAYLDEDFDRQGLAFLEQGRIADWAEFFDSYKVSPDDESQQITTGNSSDSSLPGVGGPQLGTRETCNWIAAAGVIDGTPSVIVDYIPIYASPLGVAFAYCDQP